MKKLSTFISADIDIICISAEENLVEKGDTRFFIERLTDDGEDQRIDFSLEDLENLEAVINTVIRKYKE